MALVPIFSDQIEQELAGLARFAQGGALLLTPVNSSQTKPCKLGLRSPPASTTMRGRR